MFGNTRKSSGVHFERGDHLPVVAEKKKFFRGDACGHLSERNAEANNDGNRELREDRKPLNHEL
jgi:hypothetical protein